MEATPPPRLRTVPACFPNFGGGMVLPSQNTSEASTAFYIYQAAACLPDSVRCGRPEASAHIFSDVSIDQGFLSTSCRW